MPPIRVVLVRTFSPGNLGSAARAAKCFGADLVLLDPRAEPSHPDAGAHASGAEDVLAGARRVESLEDALEGADAVLALTSLRGRACRGLPPSWTFGRARREAARPGRTLALVFGPERSGLTTEEVRSAQGRLSLPTRPDFPTLNLAQAVAATLALLEPGRRGAANAVAGEPPAGAGDLGRLRAALGEALARTGFYRGKGDDTALAELVAPLLRSRPSRREATLWTAALKSVAGAR